MDEAGPVGPRLLLVDDDLNNLAALREALEAEGIRVVGQASDGASAIELATSLAPDVVLMGLGMPGIDGFEATRAIRAARADTMVMILTAYEEPLTRSAESVGAFAYLVKGCSPTLMRSVILQAWRRGVEERRAELPGRGRS